ncbi:hypothetical protein [Prochlorococcus marinus]|uniref:hypothetical protein n=1 Tax=Prochlorococcus marinus TaxID=1219 RepID=UPI0022B5179D|nr:hypothetical protein [Prochlorococcus marinus]
MNLSFYNSGKLTNVSDHGPFNRTIAVYGLEVAGLRGIGGNSAVDDEFIRKVAQTIKILLDPNGKDIDKNAQLNAIKKLKEIDTLQRVGAGEYTSYNPRLDDGNYSGWDITNDSHSVTDFIWQYNLPGEPMKTSNDQITEVLEHLLHTLVRFALPGAYPDVFLLIDERSENYKSYQQPILSGLLYEAAKEAIKNKVFDPSSYYHLGQDSYDYWKTVMVEYQYALTFAEWNYIKKYVQGGSLDPEWSDSFLTVDAIKNHNPLGHKLFDEYISKVIVKPSEYQLEEMFRADNLGISNYIPDSEDYQLDSLYTLDNIKDYDGNFHGYLGDSASIEVISGYKYQGKLDVNNDGIIEAIFTNSVSGRWVTASIDPITGAFDYTKHGVGGTTRIVGIYQDPLVANGTVEKDSVFDGSRTFINDLKLDNLILKTVGDFDSDGFQELYWSKVDNSAYLRAVMHADGNIQYANYQNLQQMTDYLTSNDFIDTIKIIA